MQNKSKNYMIKLLTSYFNCKRHLQQPNQEYQELTASFMPKDIEHVF